MMQVFEDGYNCFLSLDVYIVCHQVTELESTFRLESNLHEKANVQKYKLHQKAIFWNTSVLYK